MDEAAKERAVVQLLRAVVRPFGVIVRFVRAVVRLDPGLAAILAMAVTGLGVSIYLTVTHYEHVPAACPTSGVVNCESVLHSAYSNVPLTTIPITVPGLLWFLVSGGLAVVGLLSIARNRPEPERLRLGQCVWSAAGLLFVLYLVYAEIVKVHSICLWCTSVHILTLITFVIALNRLQSAATAPAPARAATGRTRPAQPGPSAHTLSRASAARQAAARHQASGPGSRAQVRSRKR